jgi:hypothetical protein
MEQLLPIQKYDNLGRNIYTKWNEAERTVKKYWNDTTNLKILYKFYADVLRIEAFDLNGKTILFYSETEFFVDLNNIKINKDKLFFRISKANLNKWKELLKEENKTTDGNEK